MADRWSLLRVCREAGLTEATGRAMVRLGHLNPADLDESDVVAARVAAAITGALPAPGTVRARNAPTEVSDRDALAVLRARRIASAGVNPEAYLVLTTSTVRLATTTCEVAALLDACAGEPLMLLPIGAWVTELPSRTAVSEGRAA